MDMDMPSDTAQLRVMYWYRKDNPNNSCCSERFFDHASWKKHCGKRHASLTKVYVCHKCHSEYSSINAVSSHFARCKADIVEVDEDTGNVDERITQKSPDQDFQCQWCDLAFSSKTGLGVHARRRHPNEFEETKNVTRTKAHWTDEEIRLLAVAEMQLPVGTRFVNMALKEIFPHRTIESIKGIRNKKGSYKAILEEVTASQSANLGAPQRRLPRTPVANGTPLRRSLPTAPFDLTQSPVAAGTPRGNLPNPPIDLGRTAETGGTPRRSLPATPIDLDRTGASEQGYLHDIPEAVDDFEVSLRATYSCDPELKELVEPILNGSDDLSALSEFFKRKHFHAPKSNRGKPSADSTRYRNKKKLKRYARYQQMFRRNKRNLADMILNDKEEASTYPSVESVKNTYQTLYESVSPTDDEPVLVKKDCRDNLFRPILADEISSELKTMKNSAAGIDNLTLTHLKAMSQDYVLTLLNVQLWKRKQLECLNENRTTLIPKTKDELEKATNWRPITLSSMLVRLFHRVLSN